MALQSHKERKRYLLKDTVKIRNIYLYIVLKTAVDFCTHAHMDIILFGSLAIAHL